MESPGCGDADDRSETGSQAGSYNGHSSQSNSNVQVVVRVRPPNEREKEQGYTKIVSVDPSETCLFLKEKAQPRPFTFDYVADEATTQDSIFQRIGRPIAESCLQGYHCCLLAYGKLVMQVANPCCYKCLLLVILMDHDCSLAPKTFVYPSV
jgi:hypothetical protein